MMELIPGIRPSSDALGAEKIRMDIIAQNIANANTTKDLDGEPYKRKLVEFESVLHHATSLNPDGYVEGVKIRDIVEDKNPGPKVFNPAHPHADTEGFVKMPNVQVQREMVDLISSSRAYEANLSVIKTARSMARQALSIGR